MRTFFFTKQGVEASKKITLLSRLPKCMCILLFMISLYLIAFFYNNDILINVGIGILSSSIVTAIFMFVDYINKYTSNIKERAIFLEKFEMNLVPSIEKDELSVLKSDIRFVDYIVLQHRKYHDCYKMIQANNSDDVLVQKLIDEINIIVNNGSPRIMELFDSQYYRIYNGAFEENEVKKLSSYYNNFRAMERKVAVKDEAALYYAAMWLTDARLLVEWIAELKILNKINYIVDNRGFYVPDYTKIEKEEMLIKYRNEFARSRTRNIKKNFGKKEECENMEEKK